LATRTPLAVAADGLDRLLLRSFLLSPVRSGPLWTGPARLRGMADADPAPARPAGQPPRLSWLGRAVGPPGVPAACQPDLAASERQRMGTARQDRWPHLHYRGLF